MTEPLTYIQRLRAITIALATVAHEFGMTMAAVNQATKAFAEVVRTVQVVDLVWSPVISKEVWMIVWTLRMKKRGWVFIVYERSV